MGTRVPIFPRLLKVDLVDGSPWRDMVHDGSDREARDPDVPEPDRAVVDDVTSSCKVVSEK